MKIMCDSTCDLPLSFIEENDIHLFPLLITIGDKEFRDGYDLDTDQIYDAIKRGVRPKTAQVALGDFYLKFKQLAEAGEEGLYISLSSKLSGTYATANMALEGVKAEYPDTAIRIVDSKTGSLGEAVLIHEALKMKEAGSGLDEIAARVGFMADNLVTLLTISDLNWLAQGGRISKRAAAIGSVVQINPVLRPDEGAVVVSEKIRGKKRVNKRVTEIVENEADQLARQTIAVAYSDDRSEGEKLLAEIRKHFEPADIIFLPIGATIATHSGLGTLGVAFLKKYE